MKKIVLVLALALTGCATFGEGGPVSEDDARIQYVEYQIKTNSLKPRSVQFRNVRVNAGVVCGEVNAKGKDGKYVGFKRFYGTQKFHVLQSDEIVTDPTTFDEYDETKVAIYAYTVSCQMTAEQQQAARSALP